jgi:hypothetical protein
LHGLVIRVARAIEQVERTPDTALIPDFFEAGERRQAGRLPYNRLVDDGGWIADFRI